MASPRLSRREPAGPVRGVVLMLHGGVPTSTDPVHDYSGSLRRSAAMRAALLPRLEQADLAAWLLRYAARGWNEGAPVADARWALEQVHATHPGVPVVLLGHSMGARTAVHCADDPAVLGVVALAPWLPPSEPVEPLVGRRLAAAHGSRDRITSARATRAYVERAVEAGAEATFTDMGFIGHYMLTHVRRWNRFALHQTLGLFEAAR